MKLQVVVATQAPGTALRMHSASSESKSNVVILSPKCLLQQNATNLHLKNRIHSFKLLSFVYQIRSVRSSLFDTHCEHCFSDPDQVWLLSVR